MCGVSYNEAIKPGTRLRSNVCTTEVVVVSAPRNAIDLRCGGRAMIPQGGTPESESFDGSGDGTILGKRYTDGENLEVICTKAGKGGLSVGDLPLGLKEAAPLPSSD